MQQAQANAQAQALEQEAAAEQENRIQESMRQRRNARIARATAESQYAASGVALEGTPSQALASMAARDEMETIMYESASEQKRRNLLTQAQNTRILGDYASKTATVGAIGTGLGGLASAARIGYELGQKK